MTQPFSIDRKTLYALLALFSLFSLFSSGKWTLAIAAWIVPVLGLYLIHRLTAGRGFLLLFLASYVSISIAWYGAAAIPMPFYPVFMLINALVGTLPYLLDRLLTPRMGRSFLSTLVFPCAVTAIEFFMMSGGPLGSFGAQAYSQYGFSPFTQLASVTGLWGITFIVSWFASLANWALRQHTEGRPYLKGVTVYASVLAVILAFGTLRLLTAPEAQQTVQISTFTAAHVDMGEMMGLLAESEAAFQERTKAQHALYLDRTAAAAEAGAELILWPELAGLGLEEDVNQLVAEGQALAREHGLYLAMPLYSLDPTGDTPNVNKIVVADPQGELVLEHIKYGGNLLEGTLLGSGELQTVETPFGTLSAVICWDTDYPEVIRQAGAKGVNILLSPAYVWPEVAAIHAEMATFRSIENGMTVVRVSDGGYSLVSDPYGRVVAWENPGEAMVAAAPILSTRALYPVVGDVVGSAAMLGLAVAILVVIILRVWQLRGRAGSYLSRRSRQPLP